MEADGRDLSEEVEAVLGSMRMVIAAKIEEYGTERYEEEDPKWAMIMAYSDLYRKNLRLRTLTEAVAGIPDDDDIEALRDCLLDLANYAVLGLQQLEHFYPKTNEGESDV